ncbi:MAG: transposase [Bacteroidetes bacterium]|nr:transposase [Bacteroidota bacterium]
MRNESKILAIIERQKESGLTVIDFCTNEGIAPATFYNWKKKLRGSKEKRFIPIEIKNSPNFPFDPNANHKQEGNGQVYNECIFEIGYPNGTILRVKNDLGLLQLKALINLLD